MQEIVMPIATLLLIGYLVYNLWRHIKKECQRDRNHADHYGDNSQSSDDD